MLSGKKTYSTGVGAIAVCIGMYLQDPDAMPLGTMISTVVTALLAMFVRSGVKSEAKKKFEKVLGIDDAIDGIIGRGMSVGSIEQHESVDDGREREGLQEGSTGQPRLVPGSTEDDSKT